MAKKFIHVDPVDDTPVYINPDHIISVQDGTTEDNDKWGRTDGTALQKTVTKIYLPNGGLVVFGKASDIHHKIVDALD